MLNFLLSIAEDGTQDILKKTFTASHKDMLKVARNRLRSLKNADSAAEDAVENAFLKILKYAKNLPSSDRELRAYAITVTINECTNILLSDDEPLSLCDDFPDKSFDEESFIESLHLKERYDDVVKGIKLLPDRYRTALYLKYVLELSVEEIAEEIAAPIKTVYTRLCRGKMMLKEYLERRWSNDRV